MHIETEKMRLFLSELKKTVLNIVPTIPVGMRNRPLCGLLEAGRPPKASGAAFPRGAWERFQILLLSVCVGISVGISACGRWTPPHPTKAKDSFGQLQVFQRGEALRLSWVMKKAIAAPATQRFRIEELELKPDCIKCPPQLTKVYQIPFPSEHFTISGKNVYFLLLTRKDLNVHLYKVTHQSEDGDELSSPQAATFTGFVDFPAPPLFRWRWLPPETLPQLAGIPTADIPSQAKEIRVLRISWEPLQERVEFYFAGQADLTQKKIFYRINIYRTPQGKPWLERPINGRPIAEPFYIDYQKQTDPAWHYQMRLVDSRGNESAPSGTYTIAPEP